MRENAARRPAECLIVANPAAGTVSEALVEQAAEIAARHVPSVRVFWTSKRGEATREVRRHAAEMAGEGRAGVVVAVGGDGTVHEVVEGLVWKGAPVPAEQALFVVPAGTGNSNYRSHWGDLPWSDALEAALSGLPGTIARLDLARVAELEELVVLGAGAGLTAKVLESAREVRLTGRARLAAALEHAAAQFTPYEGRVTIDGVVLHEGKTVLANVGGGPYRAWQYTVLPHSVLDDGLLDVCVVGAEVDAIEVPRLLKTAEHLGLPGVFYGQGKRVVIERIDGAPLCFEHDGELKAGIGPRFTVEIMPAALPTLCAPAKINGTDLRAVDEQSV
jgi:diacylglycerol kinase (ATP)